MGRWGLALLVCVFVARSACAEDAGLKSLSAQLIAIRGTHGSNTQRDAGPELTPIKRSLREWIEAQLPSLKEQDDPKVFSDRLNAALKAARLTCVWNDKQCEEPPGAAPGFAQENARGYLSDVSASYLEFRHYLAVKTNVGVRCGFDESAYIYEWREKSWHLLLQTEQDRYDDKHYAPQNFLAIKASPTGVAWNQAVPKPALILTLGYSPWCQSNWQMLYTRLWRVSPADSAPKPLIDDSDELYVGDDTIADAQVSDDDVLIEFEGRSIDGDVLIRPHVRHLLVRDNAVSRIAPVALEPNQFVDEWLSQPWAESANWIGESVDRSSLRTWYDRFHKGEIVFGEFDEEGPRRCRSDPTLWQVGFTQQAGPKNPELTGYFLVRWTAPYRFALVDIRKEKSRKCDIADSMRDNVGTLFPFH
jgi:hypothetical protein